MRDMMTLREAMDRLFDDAYTQPISNRGGFSAVPAIDLYQTEDEVVVKASLPGLKADDVHISVTNGILSLSGEYKQDEVARESTYHIREHRQGAFERSFTLPVEVETDKAKADFKDGILTITLPKAEAVKPRTISIKAK
jgi:HSP20 family protein